MNEIVNPAELAPPRGYSHAVAIAGDTRQVVIAGQIGSDATGQIAAPGDLVAQFDRTLANVVTAVTAAGGEPQHVTRMRIYVVDVAAYRGIAGELSPVWRRHFGRYYPAMTLIGVAGLVEPEALVEIDADAAIPEEAQP